MFQVSDFKTKYTSELFPALSNFEFAQIIIFYPKNIKLNYILHVWMYVIIVFLAFISTYFQKLGRFKLYIYTIQFF